MVIIKYSLYAEHCDLYALSCGDQLQTDTLFHYRKAFSKCNTFPKANKTPSPQEQKNSYWPKTFDQEAYHGNIIRVKIDQTGFCTH